MLREGVPRCWRELLKRVREAGGGPVGVVERVERLDQSGRPAGVVEGRFPEELRRDVLTAGGE